MSDQPHLPDDPLVRLIRAAGNREMPPAQVRERALAAATQVWNAKVRRRQWRVAASFAAGVAVLAVSAGIALQSINAVHAPVATPIAQVARLIGPVHFHPVDADDWRVLREQEEMLPAGAVVRTEARGAAALQIENVSVRIAGGAEVVLESRSRLRLVHGKVYLDTGGGGSGRMLVITDAGSVSDVGTQFEVQYVNRSYHVRVRDGEILLQRGAQRSRGVAGEQLSIDPDGAIRVSPIASNDPAWSWVHALSTPPDIDNQPLTILLAWVARETGVSVRYATPAIEHKASTTILHGSVRNMEPLEALAVMLATTDLRHDVLSDGTIMIK
jgi:ferric-dicitrate binding protein FerR (iron transport regulator)